MAIDNEYDAIDKAFAADESYIPNDLAALVLKLMLPGYITTIIGAVCKRLTPDVQSQRAMATLKLLVADMTNLKSEVADNKKDLDGIKEAVQLAVRYDVNEFNDKKRERYVEIIGNALRDEKQTDDLTSYIQDVERLGERDVTALRVLNKVMNKPGDWTADRPTLPSHVPPTSFIQRRQELNVQMAEAFGIRTEGNRFSREEGYDACNRLQAFGLAHEIELSARRVPIDEYAFRPSLRGLTLLKLIGDEVPNWDKYNP
jgi:hypothetical protein